MIDDSKSSLIQLKRRWLKVSFSMRQFVEMKTLVSSVFITPSSFKAILCWNISNLIMVRPWICREIVHEPEADAVSGLMKAHWKSLEGAFSNGMQTLSQSHWSFKLHPHPAWIHTWYLSFFLHEQNFWRIKFTPKKRVNYDKVTKYTVNCQFFVLLQQNTQ